jgi:hypothetical protein
MSNANLPHDSLSKANAAAHEERLNTAQQIAMHAHAAEQFEYAARHHREAVKCYEIGNHQAARFHAYMAHGYAMDICHFADKMSARLCDDFVSSPA